MWNKIDHNYIHCCSVANHVRIALFYLAAIRRLSFDCCQQESSNLRAECKLLVFFFYFALAAALSLIFFTIGSQNISQDQEGFTQYFACEALGVNLNNPCVFTVDRLRQQAFTIASFVMYTMGPYLTLVFIVPVNKMKEKWETWTKKLMNTCHPDSVAGT